MVENRAKARVMNRIDHTALTILYWGATSYEGVTTRLDDAALDKITVLVEVPPANREAFKRVVGNIVSSTHCIAISTESKAIWDSLSRRNVIHHLDDLIAALDPLLLPGGEIMAAGFFLAGEPRNGTEAVEMGLLGQRFVLELLEKAQRAKEIATKTKWLFGRGGPRRARGSPALDCFLMHFLGAAQYFEAKRLTASKSHRKAGVAVTGTIVDVLYLVAPCIHKNFLAYTDTSILYAIDRWRREVKTLHLTFPRQPFWVRQSYPK